MKKLFGLVVALSFVTLCSGCAPSTFLLTKDGNSAYFGRDRFYFYTRLCLQGELDVVLSDTALSDDLKNDFRKYVCSDQRSYDKVVSLYLFLTPAEKAGLKKAFEKHGYEVNFIHC